MSGSRFKAGVPKLGQPPAKLSTPAAEAFVSGAPRKGTMPWQAPAVRDDLYVQLNVKMPEKLMLAIDWLALDQATTKRAVVELALEEYANRELKRRGLTY